MRKRTIPLFLALAVLLIAAVPAQANHCARCQFSVDMQWCKFGTLIGSEGCEINEFGECMQTGNPCRHAFAAVTPLASEFEVASVERIDEAPAPDQSLVARLDAAPAAAQQSTH